MRCNENSNYQEVGICSARDQEFSRLTARDHLNNGEAPHSFATSAKVRGPTYALTAALIARVGKWGYVA